ncbi:MAG: hypothetical protein K2L14_10610 [Duncaniella sp.]|nr:hypothetical protein [Duncaniella sp.]
MATNFAENLNQIYMEPVYFRIIGIGSATKDAVKTLKEKSLVATEVTLAEHSNDITPRPDDRMVILMAEKATEEFKTIARRFLESDVLTLAVVSEVMDNPEKIVNSYTVKPLEEFAETAGILMSVIIDSPLVNLDYHDLWSVMSISSRFYISKASAGGVGRVKKAIEDADKKLGNVMSTVRFIMVLYMNRDSPTPLRMNEIPAITDYIAKFPHTDVAWGVYFANSLPDDKIEIAIISAGIN